jgi:hypothetical protein
MLKRVAGILAAIVLVAAAACASDAWKDKDYTSWDEKDVQKILQDSPWSHKIQYGMNSGGHMEGNLSGGAPDIHTDTSNVGSGGTTTMGRNRGAGGGDNAPGVGSETIFVVSWVSSSTIREAKARRRELAGTPADEARKALSTPPDTYEIMVASPNMRAFARSTEDELKAEAFLTLKDTKGKISPSRVVLQKGQTGAPTDLLFLFDKKTATGEPTFAPNEKGVEFSFQAGKTTLKITFDFSKMQNKEGLDL